MKKVLYLITSIAAIIYIVLMAMYGLSMNLADPFLVDFFISDFFQFIVDWMPLAIMGGFALTFFFEKSIKILFFILLLVGIILYIITFGFPQIFA